jgi:dihydroneopterin aldolase
LRSARPDAILIDAIQVPCALGVTAEERALRRAVRIDLELGVDLGAAAASDDLAETVDYGEVVDVVAEVAGRGEHQLVEALGRRIIDALFDRFDGLSWVEITVRKPNPLDAVLDHTGCRLTRSRGE